MKNWARDNFIAGMFVLIPLAAVLWILLWIWQIFWNLAALLPDQLDPKFLLKLDNPFLNAFTDISLALVVMFAVIGFICVVGVASRHYLGLRVLKVIGMFMAKVPVLSTVYTTLDQLLKTFTTGSTKNFRKVVWVEYPRKGLFTLAFVTGEKESPDGKLLRIYVPTTPNPTSGFYLSVKQSEVRDSSKTVEEALKEIISLGIVQNDAD